MDVKTSATIAGGTVTIDIARSAQTPVTKVFRASMTQDFSPSAYTAMLRSVSAVKLPATCSDRSTGQIIQRVRSTLMAMRQRKSHCPLRSRALMRGLSVAISCTVRDV
jgi:hypothetical protein